MNVPYPSEYNYVKKSLERTTRWAEEKKYTPYPEKQALFGIVQGGMYKDLKSSISK